MPEKRHRIRPQTTQRARTLRRAATFPERLLWSRLRAGRLAGLKFRRQHALGPFVADFYCAEARLVIEIDGRTHDERQEHDRRRTDYLSGLGLRVIRYSNDDVLDGVDAVAEDIARHAGWNGEIVVTQPADPPPAPP